MFKLIRVGWIFLVFCDYQIAAQQVVQVPEIANLTAKDYRLEPDIWPENYNISIKLEQNFHNTSRFTILNCSIIFNVSKTALNKQLSDIRIHYDLDFNKEDSVQLFDKYGDKYNITMESPHPETQIATIKILNDEYLSGDAQPFTLVFSNLTGTLRTDNNGFYLSSYEHNNITKYVATTQFETIFARSAFPCFDEPLYKATFDISITKPKSYTTVLSNTHRLREQNVMGTNLTKVTFGRTPKMSTYLVAFVVSTFENISDPTNANYSVYYPEGNRESAQYALNITRKIIEDLGNTTGSSYPSLGNPQLYEVALPDFSAGAMENWGLMTYRESILLWDPRQSTHRNKQNVLTVVSHEISHSWFGDLVTLNWWSETWLNEGFATYFEYHTAANVEPDFDLNNQFVYKVVQAVFLEDAISSSQPLSSKPEDVFTIDQIGQKFGWISYEKGASIVRMIEHIMTTPKFHAALQKYLTNHRYNNTVPADLFKELELEGLPPGSMKEWTEESGFPVVTVRRINNSVVLSQERFLVDEAKSTTRWSVPITYATEIYNRDFRNTRPTEWLKNTEDLVIDNVFDPFNNWIIVNVQQTGYYRVDYDQSLWSNLTQILKLERNGYIIPINRAQIVDDVMNMARIKKQPYKVAMDVTNYLADETDYYPWAAAIQSFKYIVKQSRGDKKLLNMLREYLIKLSTNVVGSVSFLPKPTDPHMTVMKSVLIMNFACYLGEETCWNNSRKEFVSYKNNPELYYLNPNIKTMAYCYGIAGGNQSDWDFLYGQFRKSNSSSENGLLLSSLACTQNTTILKSYLEMSLNTSSGIRRQDADSVLLQVMAMNSTMAFEFFKNNIAKIRTHYASMNVISSIVESFAEVFTTKEEVDDFEKFINENKAHLADASGSVAEIAILRAKNNLKWLATFGEELKEWLTVEKAGEKASGYAVSSSFAIILVSVVIAIFY